MNMKKIPCGNLQGGVSCDIPAKLQVSRTERVGYVMKGCGCGRVTAHLYKHLPAQFRLK